MGNRRNGSFRGGFDLGFYLAQVGDDEKAEDIFVNITRLRGGSVEGTYNTITDALTGAIPGDTVLVGQGTYPENIVIPTGVTVISTTQNPRGTVIVGQGGGPAVTMNHLSDINNMAIVQAADGSDVIEIDLAPGETTSVRTMFIRGDSSAGAAVHMKGDGTAIILNLIIDNATTKGFAECFRSSGAGVTFLREWIMTGTGIDCVRVDSGVVKFTNIRVLGDNAFYTNALRMVGPGDLEGDEAHFGIEGTIENGLVFDSGSDGATVNLVGGDLFGDVADIVNVAGSTGVGTRLAGNFHYRQERIAWDATWVENADLNISHVDRGIEDESATKITGPFQVGKQDRGYKASMGEGGPTTQYMHVFTDDGSGTAFVDETTAARSKDGSTFALFQAVTAGNVTYIGNTRRVMYGFQANIPTTGIDMGGGSIVTEYWDGVSWVDFSTMSTRADPPIEQNPQPNGDLNLPVGNTNIRYCDIQSQWVSNTVNGLEAYWVRLRIASDIAVSPIVERVVLHPSYTLINADGFQEFFGNAQHLEDLVWHKNLDDDLSGSSPGNGAISFTANIVVTPANNRFSSTALDGNGGILEIPVDVDTSRDLLFEINWIGKDNSAGDVEFELISSLVRFGDVLDGTLAEVTQTIVSSVAINEADVLHRTTFNLDISELSAGDLVAFAYRRDGTGGNPNDTYSGNVDIVRTVWRGIKWH